jgi:signal transduction histidine kinase
MADYEQAVDRALGEADGLLDTFAALLRIAQIESGSRRAGFSRLDLSALVSSIGQTFAPVAEDDGRTLKIDVSEGVEIEGDRELLTQMLANLIENAIHHTGAGAQLALSLTAGADGPCLCVCDDGPGIPVAEHANVVQRFYRLERSRTHPGNGLGLALVAAIVDLHGARLGLADNGPGLRVTIQFPSS